MVYRSWSVRRPNEEDIKCLQQELSLPELVCSVLAARGYVQPEQARALFEDTPLSDPMLIAHMATAVQRIHRAIDQGERIVVFGDYDVDGITATALLYTYLDTAGAQVFYKLPNRASDGYGLTVSAVEMMAEKSVQLVITVDNGISAVSAVERAVQLGIDVIITDHHVPPQVLPPAVAIVNPQQTEDTSPCKTLCGAGIAFKLICALEGATCEELLPCYAEPAAIGTVADVAVLEGENRTLVKAGLELMRDTERAGLRALLEQCGVDAERLNVESISFGIAPRLNAAGRMSDAITALDLLMCEDCEEALKLAQQLDSLNEKRREAEREISAQILHQIEQDESMASDRIIVAWGAGWHTGVIGIVASRMTERFGRPVVLVAIDEHGEGRGSGRSIEGVDLHAALVYAQHLLTQFGGHKAAAGLSIQQEQLPALRATLNEWALREHPVLHHPPFVADAAVRLSQLDTQQVRALELLAPFGNGNPTPVLAVYHVMIDAVWAVGEGRHTRVRLRDADNVLSAMLFGVSPEELPYAVGACVDVLLTVSIFEAKSGPMVSAQIRDLRPAGMGNCHTELVSRAYAAMAGVLPEAQQRAELCPLRDEVAAVYRLTAAVRGVNAVDLRPVFARLGEQRAGKIVVALKALEQLGLVECVKQTGQVQAWCAVPTKEKKDLSSAPILRALQEE